MEEILLNIFLIVGYLCLIIYIIVEASTILAKHIIVSDVFRITLTDKHNCSINAYPINVQYMEVVEKKQRS